MFSLSINTFIRMDCAAIRRIMDKVEFVASRHPFASNMFPNVTTNFKSAEACTYVIYNISNPLIYIGETINSLVIRFSQHLNNAKDFVNDSSCNSPSQRKLLKSLASCPLHTWRILPLQFMDGDFEKRDKSNPHDPLTLNFKKQAAIAQRFWILLFNALDTV